MRWGTWISSPHQKPGGASRTGWREEGQQDLDLFILVLLSFLWPPVTLPLPLPLLSQTQQEAVPGFAIAAGTSITSGSLEQGGAVCPRKDSGVREEAWL